MIRGYAMVQPPFVSAFTFAVDGGSDAENLGKRDDYKDY